MLTTYLHMQKFQTNIFNCVEKANKYKKYKKFIYKKTNTKNSNDKKN